MMDFEALTKLIRERKSTYAYDFCSRIVDQQTINKIVSNALWAPTHKNTQPWRFIVLQGRHQVDLGEFMAEYYRRIYTERQFSEDRYQETKKYTLNATILAIIFCPNKSANLPEWEEVAALSCAVQNIWLSCTALGLGGYWDTCQATMEYGKRIKINNNEKFLGFFLMGYPKENTLFINRKRKPLSKKIEWYKD